jgi:tetratricopeptide (TPR) repeat protein
MNEPYDLNRNRLSREIARRRRLALALAASMLALVALGGGGSALWLQAESQARQEHLPREVNDALNRATVLREQARAAAVGSDALFGQAREQVQRAVALAESGPAEAVLLAQVQQVQAELGEEQKDRQFLAALEAARLAQAETVADENRFAPERALPLFREAFAAYGLPVGQGEPAAAAARLRQRPEVIRQAVLAALQEWVDLAANPRGGQVEPHLDWLRAVAVALEPDQAWARQLRMALEEKDLARRRAALEQLAREADVAKMPVLALTRLAARLRSVGAATSAVQVLRRAQQRYPADFWVNHELGTTLLALPGEAEEAVRYMTAAMALRPDSPGVQLNLGAALQARGQLEEAIACYRRALALDPKYAAAHCNLGILLQARGQREEAIACFRQALALDPRDARAHNNLGVTLKDQGRLDEAIVCFRQAIALDPKDARAHYNLGAALQAKRQVDDAIACYRRAIELDPRDARAHTNLGVALQAKGRLEEAIACYRRAIELDPKDARAHGNLGIALWDRGQLEEAITCYRRAIELDPKSASARSNLARAERMVSARDKLPAFRSGNYAPATTEERLALAEWCALQKLHHTAAGLYAAAFVADPRLADDLNAAHRYNAACHAVLAGTGHGADAAKLDDKQRVRLRQLALDWLRADLTLWQKQLQSARPAEAGKARAVLQHWQKDVDLASVREPNMLAKLAAEEREPFTKLWADVAALLKKAEDRPKGEQPK